MTNTMVTARYTVHTAQRTILGPSWRTQPEKPPLRDPFNRIYLVHGGEGRIRRNGDYLRLEPGFLYRIPSGSELYLCGAADMDISWAHYDRDPPGRAAAFTADDRIAAKPDPIALYESLFECLRQVQLRSTSSGKERSTWAQDAVLQGIMHALLEPFDAQMSQPRKGRSDKLADRLEPLFPYIESQLSQPLRTSELAERAGMETAYFSQMFKEYTGLPPARYVRRRRLEAAARELLRTERTLKQIAEACGFCDAYHLAKVFKADMGVNPGDFRKRGVLP